MRATFLFNLSPNLNQNKSVFWGPQDHPGTPKALFGPLGPPLGTPVPPLGPLCAPCAPLVPPVLARGAPEARAYEAEGAEEDCEEVLEEEADRETCIHVGSQKKGEDWPAHPR